MKIVWNFLLIAPAILVTGILKTLPASATPIQTVAVASLIPEADMTTAPLTTAEPSFVLEPALEPASVSTEPIASLSTTSRHPAPSVNTPAVAPNAIAQNPNPLQQYALEGQGAALEQVTSVNQLSDVQPTDWAFQALSRLITNYGCIAGYPDGTYRGQRALTRYEFAAGLNACLDAISERIGQGVSPEDLAQIRRLQEEFRAELATLRGRVDALEARTNELEANQFSTTTKLIGDALFYLADIFGGDALNARGQVFDVGDSNNAVFQSRVRLTLDTSFSGRDRLRTRLQAGNFQLFTQPGNEARLAGELNTSNNIVLDVLSYQFPLGPARVEIFGNGGSLDQFAFGNVITPFDLGATRGAISRFGQRSPIYRVANTNVGAAVNFPLSSGLSLQLGYGAARGNDPSSGAGLFGGSYGLLGQLTARNLFGSLDLGFTYVNAYTGLTAPGGTLTTGGIRTGTGSILSEVRAGRPVVANSYGIEANWKISPTFQVGGWANYSAIRAIRLGDANVWNYGLTLAFPDLGGKGNLGGIIVGIEPRLTGSSPALGSRLGRRRDPDTGLHVEGFYRFAVTDNIDITPGVIWLTAPNHNSDNDDIFVGLIRTTFRF